jgi:predicted RNA-binding protein with PIN domain
VLPPPALRRYLNFAKLNARSVEAIARVVDRDDEFRARVASVVDEQQVGRAGWLWLTRPEGWAPEVAELDAVAAARAADAVEQREERTATRKLAAARAAAARAEVEAAERLAALEVARAALAHEQAARAAAEARVAELEAVVDGLTSARAEVVRNLKDVESRLVDRGTEVNAVKARIRSLEAEVRERRHRTDADTGADAPPTTRGGDAPVAPPVAPPSVAADVAAAAAAADTEAGAPAAPYDAQVAHRSEVPPDAAGPSVDPAALAGEVARAARGATELAEALAALTRLLGGDVPGRPGPDPGETPVAPVDRDGATTGAAGDGGALAGDAGTPRTRRVPVALPGGMFDDSVEAAEHLLRTPGAVLVVDGYNVTMAGWPELRAADQRRRLLVAVSDLAARTATRVELVFDGAEVEPLSVPAPTRQLVRVRFSDPGVEADDVVIDLVGRIPAATPVIVASSDNRVRDGSRRGGANLLHAHQLVAVLRR